jgi:hypothetical protein
MDSYALTHKNTKDTKRFLVWKCGSLLHSHQAKELYFHFSTLKEQYIKALVEAQCHQFKLICIIF